MVLSNLFKPKASILFSLDEAARALHEYGFSIENMKDRSMGDQPMQRLKVKRDAFSFILVSDGRIITFLALAKLTNEWSDRDIIEWNLNKSYMTFTYSPEGNLAILKHHCFISEGVPEKTFLRLSELWIALMSKFLDEMGLSETDWG